jgi:hypothetical protein
MLNQLEAAIKTMPDVICSVPVRQDASEDHSVEANVCFNWMNDEEGRKYQYGNPEQQQAFENVYLHWQAHTAMVAKLAAQNAPKPQPKVNFSVQANKLPPKEQAEVVQAGGIQADPNDFEQQATVDMNRDIAAKVVPDQLYTSGLHQGQ